MCLLCKMCRYHSGMSPAGSSEVAGKFVVARELSRWTLPYVRVVR